MSTCDKLTGTLTLGATMSGSLLVAKGDKGEKGDAYIITEADKQEIKEALSADISELKGDLTYFNNKSVTSSLKEKRIDLIYKDGYTNLVDGWIKPDGSIGISSDAYVTNFIKVDSGRPVIIRYPNDYPNGTTQCCFYDDSKNMCENGYFTLSNVRLDTNIVLPPDDAKYIRFTFLNSYTGVKAFQYRECCIYDKTANNKSNCVKKEYLHNLFYTDLDFAEGYIATSGWAENKVVYTNTTAYTTPLIELFNTSNLIKDMGKLATSGTSNFSFFDENMNFISNTSSLVTDGIVEVPTNAKFFRMDLDKTWLPYIKVQQMAEGTVVDASLLPFNTPFNSKYRGLMAGFGNTEVSLRVFGTKNFNYFEQIGRTFRPNKGNKACRDPFIMIYGEWYYVLYSDTISFRNVNNDIGVCRTRDFETYEELDPIVCNSEFVLCWAPSVIEDNGNYYLTVTASKTAYDDTKTYIYDLDMDTLSISNETIVSIGTSTRQLDFHFTKNNGRWIAVGKYDDMENTVIAKSSTLKGEYEVIAEHKYTGYSEEGQQLVRLDNGKWRLFLNDYYSNKKIKYVDIADIDNPTVNISDVKEIVNNSPVDLYHVFVMDFNRPYSFEEV